MTWIFLHIVASDLLKTGISFPTLFLKKIPLASTAPKLKIKMKDENKKPRWRIHFSPTVKLPKEEGYWSCSVGEEKE